MEKKLVLLGGPMGVGKTTAVRLLLQRLDRAVWLDGDWCWQQGRHWDFCQANREMAVDNICYVLGNFLRNERFDTVLFTWVLHTRRLRDLLLERLRGEAFTPLDLSYGYYKSSRIEKAAPLVAYRRPRNPLLSRRARTFYSSTDPIN